MSTTSPNMQLVLSTVGSDSGLSWELNLNSSLTLIDQHNHTSGYGVQIPPAGLNIDTALSFQGNQATNLGAAVFTPQSSVSTLASIYVKGVDLYFNDNAGSPAIQMTQGGAVLATSSGISSGAASASFVAGVLVVNAASNTPANIQGGSLLLGNNVAASKFLTLSPPAAMGANFTLTLPSQPAATSLIQMDSSGNMGASIPVSQGITQGMLALRASGSTVAAGGVATGVGSASTTISSVTSTLVSGCSVTITTTGRPVNISIIPTQGASSSGGVTMSNTGGGAGFLLGSLQVLRGGVVISSQTYQSQPPTTSSNFQIALPGLMATDPVSVGTYTYTVRLLLSIATNVSLTVNNPTLSAYEI